MQDAPSAPTPTLPAEAVEHEVDSVRLYPDSVARKVSAMPLGECVIAGVRCTFRRASMRDIATLEQRYGKSFDVLLKGGRASQAAVALMALTPMDGGTLPEDPLDLPWSDWSKLVSVLRFFSGQGSLVVRPAEASKPEKTAASNGEAAG